MGASLPPEGKWFRRDVEGLRAIAVVAVMLYHAEVPGFDGGYIGVDVFFVVSGFLITRLLLDELRSTGTVDLWRFYARRIRRLLPASALVAVATLVFAYATLPPLWRLELRDDAFAAATYRANLRFADVGTDYLAAHAGESPFQHYWSLALEEQFYLLWPLILLSVFLFAARVRGDTDAWLLAAVVTITVGSLLWSVHMTEMVQPRAFFLLPSRAWELGAGALLASMLARSSGAVGRVTAEMCVATGLAIIAFSTVAFGEVVQFPGWAAGIPVLGALLVLVGGETPGRLQQGLSHPTMLAVGRRSYSLYLWHWPLLLLAGGSRGGDLAMTHRYALLGLTFFLATTTYRLVEDPIRHARWLAASHRRTVVAGVGATVLVVGLVSAVSPPSLTTGARVAEADGLNISELVAHATPHVPDNLHPSLVEAEHDLPRVYADGCHLDLLEEPSSGPCDYGDREASRTMLLTGDSHAAQWFPALESIATKDGWRLLSLTKSSCPFYDVVAADDEMFGRSYVECLQWRDYVARVIENEKPTLVIMSAYVPPLEGSHEVARWAAAIDRTLTELDVDRVVVLGDTPRMPFHVPTCLSENLHSVSLCTSPAHAVLQPEVTAAERQVARKHGAQFFDPGRLLCVDAFCPVIAANLLMYRDAHHLSTAASLRFADALREALG